MGTRITAKGVDAEAFATEMGVPVRTGIRGIFLTNTNIDKAQWNYAPGSSGKGAQFGNPVVSAASAALEGQASGNPKYIDTKLVDPAEFTIIFIAKIDTSSAEWIATPPGVTLAQNLRSMPVSNYTPPGSSHAGIGFYATQKDLLACAIGVQDDGLNTGFATNIAVDMSKYMIVSARYGESSRIIRLKNHLSGLIVTSAPLASNRVRGSSGRSLRLGASVSSIYGGKLDMAAAIIHTGALSDGDIDRNAEFIKAYAIRKGVTF